MTPKLRLVSPVDTYADGLTVSVFGNERKIKQPKVKLPKGVKFNFRHRCDGVLFLAELPKPVAPVAFLDPQYRGVLDHLEYGNEGEARGARRCELLQMTDIIPEFVKAIHRVLIPSGHLFLWLDKFHLVTGSFRNWIADTDFNVVDMVTWNKKRLGMGYRTRRISERLVVLQKAPRRAKGVWSVHNIPDVWEEKVPSKNGVHPKPIGLQGELIDAVSNAGDIVIDPAAGSFSVLDACRIRGRNFLGCDING